MDPWTRAAGASPLGALRRRPPRIAPFVACLALAAIMVVPPGVAVGDQTSAASLSVVPQVAPALAQASREANALASATHSLAVGGGPSAGVHRSCTFVGPSSVQCSAGPATPGPQNASTPYWTNLTIQPLPTSVDGDGAMAYDVADGYVVLFGGTWCNTVGCYFSNETWTYQGGVWTNITLSAGTPPSGRFGMGLVFDSQDGYLLGWGGEAGTGSCYRLAYCIDTWKFLGGTWTNLTTTTNCVFLGKAGSQSCSTTDLARGFAGATSAQLVNDPADGYVLLATSGGNNSNNGGGAGVWTYRAGNWTDWNYNWTSHKTLQTPRFGAIAYDAADGYVVAFGNSADHAGDDEPGYPWLPTDTTWKWENGTWTNVTATAGVAPSPRYDPSVAYDSTDGLLVLYGGWSYTCTTWVNYQFTGGFVSIEFNDTWGFSGGRWTNLTETTTTGVRNDFVGELKDDPADRGLLSFGSWYCASASCPGKTASEASQQTWLFSASPRMVGLSLHASSAAIDNGTTVSYTSTFLGGTPPISFAWNFGDGGSSTSQDANHTYDLAGSYSPTLWVNDSAGHSLSASTQLTVAPTLAVTVSGQPDPTDAGLPTVFTALLSGGTAPFTYAWLFGDAGTSNLSNPTHSYSTAGTFHAMVWVNDSGGLSETGIALITVNSPLVLSPINGTPDPAALGRPVNFSTLASGGTPPYTYSWAFGDGGTGGNLANITHIFTTNGPFQSVATVTDAAGATARSEINVTITLNASILSNASIGAAPLVVGFQSEVTGGTPGYSYTWTFGDGAQSQAADPVHTFTGSGSFRTALRVVDSAGRSTSSVWIENVAVGGGPVGIQVSASHSQLAVGALTVITATPTGGFGRYTLTWAGLPAGCTVTSPESLNCTPMAGGTYTVTASVVDSTGEAAQGSVTLQVGLSSPRGGPFGPYSLWIAGGVVLGISLVGLLVVSVYVVRPRRRGRPAGRVGTPGSRRYARYAEPLSEGPGSAPGSPDPTVEDSLNDLI